MTLLPYPLLGLGLIFMWLLLSGFTLGQFLLSIAVAILACHALKALGEKSPAIHRWAAIPELCGVVVYDIIQSNIAVVTILLSREGRPRRSGFVAIPLRLRHPSGLAILSIIITSTPGTAWLDYNVARGEVLIHVFDLVDPEEWRTIITGRYERLLLEIFE